MTLKKDLNYPIRTFLLLFVFLGFMACSDDEEVTPDNGDEPEIMFSNNNFEDESYMGAPGDSAYAEVNVLAEEGFSSLEITKFVDGLIDLDYGQDGTVTLSSGSQQDIINFEYQFHYLLEEFEDGATVDFVFQATDGVNNTVEDTLEVMVLDENVKVYTAKLLYAPTDNGISNTFLATTSGTVYSSDDVIGTTESVSATIDFGYYYGETEFASIAGIADYPATVFDVEAEGWNTTNETVFELTSVTTDEFDDITQYDGSYLNALYGETAATQGVLNNLQVDDVIKFSTDPAKEGGSKKGFIRVLNIEPGIESNDYIEIAVKVEA